MQKRYSGNRRELKRVDEKDKKIKWWNEKEAKSFWRINREIEKEIE